MTTFVFQHGWGFDGSFFHSLAARLPGQHVFLDRGYFGPANADFDGRKPWIGVGHSLGFDVLLHMNVPWNALVAIGGFTEFAPTEERREALRNMENAFRKNSKAVLRDFYRKCKVSLSFLRGAKDPEVLLRDLRYLRHQNSQAICQSRRYPIRLLHAMDDVIVPLGQSQKDFADREILVCETGGHGLGLNQAEWCAEKIRDFTEKDEIR